MATNEVTLREIKALLQKEEVRELIRETMPIVNEARVTTGKAGNLLNLSPSKLREWDKAGLVKPERDPDSPTTSQRQYSLADLKKLVILKILDKELKDIGVDVSSVAENVDVLLQEAELALSERVRGAQNSANDSGDGWHINQRIQEARRELSLRYYTSHVFRLSLSLLSETVRDTPVGLILPLQQNFPWAAIKTIEDLPQLGPSLVGWLGKSKSSHTLLTLEPSFEYVTDFTLLPFIPMRDEVVAGEIDGVYLVLNRPDKRTRKLSLSETVVKVIHRLLAPVIENKELLREQFGSGMRDGQEPATNVNVDEDLILNGLANMIVQLGGATDSGEQRWRFCSILLPEESFLPLQKRSLVIRAQSSDPPSDYNVGTTKITSEDSMSLSLQAFRSGHMQYRNVYASKEPVVAYSEIEIKANIRSAIAVPIGGEDGLPLAVFYVASSETSHFSEDDQRVLRLMGRMIEELLRTLEARIRSSQGLLEIIEEPMVIDRAFKRVLSVTEFFQDVEGLLEEMQRMEEASEENPSLSVVSFIAIDMDHQGKVATKYGDRAVNNLNLALGENIADLVKRTLFKRHANCTLYHIYSDVFFLVLKDVTLEEAREKAVSLKESLKGPYQIDVVRPIGEQFAVPGSVVDIPDVTVRLGVTSYTAMTLRGMLKQYSEATALTEVATVIDGALKKALAYGWNEGGDCVIAWDAILERMVLWSPKSEASN